MKKNVMIWALVTLLVNLSLTVKAQSAWSADDCLGTFCEVDVYIDRAPVEANGFIKVTIPVPSEGIAGIQGPASAYFSNHLGNTIDLYVRKIHLDLAADGVNCEIPFELTVNKWVNDLGVYNTSGEGYQCYYWVKLMVIYD